MHKRPFVVKGVKGAIGGEATPIKSMKVILSPEIHTKLKLYAVEHHITLESLCRGVLEDFVKKRVAEKK